MTPGTKYRPAYGVWVMRSARSRPILVTRPRSTQLNRDDLRTLRTRLDQARRRLEAEVPYSPSWAALADWVEELERQLATSDEAVEQGRDATLVSA